MMWHSFSSSPVNQRLCRTLPRHFIFLFLGFWGAAFSGFPQVAGAQDHNQFRESPKEFSARLIWRTEGKTSKAQLFVKKDRYRIEPQGGIRTELGYAGVTIVRLDLQKIWYIFSKRRMVVSVPFTEDYRLPFSVPLEGETQRTFIGEALAGGLDAHLYEVVVVSPQGTQETFFEWVDPERGVLLKLLSQSRDWFVEYEHVVLSKQPDYFFETPLGYRKIEAKAVRPEKG